MTHADAICPGHVRISDGELPQLRLEHVTSAIDMSIALPAWLLDRPEDVLSGYTEWVGRWMGADVTIGWDWGFVRNEVVLLNAMEIRTNLKLFGANETPHSPAAGRIHLATRLQTLAWREGAIRELIQRNYRGPRWHQK